MTHITLDFINENGKMCLHGDRYEGAIRGCTRMMIRMERSMRGLSPGPWIGAGGCQRIQLWPTVSSADWMHLVSTEYALIISDSPTMKIVSVWQLTVSSMLMPASERLVIR